PAVKLATNFAPRPRPAERSVRGSYGNRPAPDTVAPRPVHGEALSRRPELHLPTLIPRWPGGSNGAVCVGVAIPKYLPPNGEVIAGRISRAASGPRELLVAN